MDVAKKYPEKLNELKALFDELAEKNRLYPLVTWDDVFEKVKKRYAASQAATPASSSK